jgi:hypothetical protein
MKNRVFVGAGFVAAAVALLLVSGTPAPAAADKDVVVINTAANPVPVTGAVQVTGATTVSGSVNAAQSGPWSVKASQSGPWLIGIDPAHNGVSLAPGASFYYDSGFSIINNGTTLDLGPFDLSAVSKMRVIGNAVNGNVKYEIRANVTPVTMVLDQFTVNGEDGNLTTSRVYDVPPPSVIVRLTESGPGGSNYQLIVVGK